MKTPMLTFAHTLSSGRMIRIRVIRKLMRIPRYQTDFKLSDLSHSELFEFRQWRDSVVTPTVDSTIFANEEFATRSA